VGTRLIVAVLAGGEGRRMGGAKALRPFRGQPLLAHALAQARRWSDEVAVVVRDLGQAGAADAPLILDRPDIEGPLAGLAAALAHARAAGAERLLTLPCDMPMLPEVMLARLEAALAPEAAVALPETAGRLQPALGLWRVGALDMLDSYLASGRSSLHGFAAACGMSTALFGPETAQAFRNANTPEELEALEGEAPPF
jgi:molybdopterin-guanine dinucleotide biosynthesis protein A